MRKHHPLLILTQQTWSGSRNQKHERELCQLEVVDSKEELFFHFATFSRRGPAQVRQGVLPTPRDMHRPRAIGRWRHTCWSSTGHQHGMCALAHQHMVLELARGAKSELDAGAVWVCHWARESSGHCSLVCLCSQGNPLQRSHAVVCLLPSLFCAVWHFTKP